MPAWTLEGAAPRLRRVRWVLQLSGAVVVVLLLVLAAWIWSDKAWGRLPPASFLRPALERQLPAPLSGLAALLPTRDAPPLDLSVLPAWRAPPVAAREVTRKVAHGDALRAAMAQALPGDVIELQSGDHTVTATLTTGHGGRPNAPIVLRGAVGARLRVDTVEAIKLSQPHWVVEHLEMVGVCAEAVRCEHALHIVGKAHDVVLHGLQLRDFNAAIKVNGEGGDWPDRGQVSHSLLMNQTPRPEGAPATPFDLVGASHWRFEDNRVWGVAKAGADSVAYGAFMKGGGQGGRMERNLIVCAPLPAFAAVGRQVGLSFGGGRTDPATLRDRQTRLEHIQGMAADNVVLNCNDTALDVNESAGIELRGNTLLGSGGILVRGQGASALAHGNVGSRPAFAMRGNELIEQGGLQVRPGEMDAGQALKTQQRVQR